MCVTGVFVNYRNADLPEVAAIIYRSIADRLGEAEVFRDLNTIQAGEHYPTSLRRALHDADILIAVVGPNWLAPADPDNPADQGRLIDRDSDWVRMEIADALRRGIPVVPVLLNDTPPPDPASLPADIRDLAKKQAHRVHRDRLDEDLNRLVSRLLELVPRLGTSRLFVPEPPARHPDSAPSTLLRAEHAVVPLLGGRPVLDRLHSWATSNGAHSVQLVTGPAGSGRTRLAMALRDRLPDDQWVTGFVSEQATADDISHISRMDRPLLLLVDDVVPARVDQLAALATAIGERSGRQSAPTRLLLLCHPSLDWLPMLRDHAEPAVREWFRPLTASDAIDLGSLQPGEPAMQFDAARDAFALALTRPVPEGAMTPLSGGGTLLDVHAVALNSVLRPDARDARQAPQQLVHGDRRHFRRLARAAGQAYLQAPVLAKIATVVTLCRPDSGEQASAVRRALPAFFDDDGRLDAHLDDHVDMYRRLYPGPHQLAPVRPDLIGHEIVAAVLADEPELVQTLATTCADDQLVNAMSVLGCALPRHPEFTSAVTDLVKADPDRIGLLGVSAALRVTRPNAFLEQLGSAFIAGRLSVPGFLAITGRMNSDLPPSVRDKLADSITQALTQRLLVRHWRSHPLRHLIGKRLYGQFVKQLVDDTVAGRASSEVWEASDRQTMTSWVAATLLRTAGRSAQYAISQLLGKVVESQERSRRDRK